MSGMSYTDPTSGHVLDVRGRADVYDATVWTTGGSSVLITAQDAPVVAGAILQFAKADATVVPGKLPEVSIENLFGGKTLWAVVRDGQGTVCNWEVVRENIEHARRCARDAAAIANAIEEYLDSEEHTSKVLQERRDKIAQSLAGVDSVLYHHMSPWGQKAVDRIIELEDQLKETSK